MAEVIRNFSYKTRGRGRGVLGLPELVPEGLRKPGGLAGLTGASAVGGGGGGECRVYAVAAASRLTGDGASSSSKLASSSSGSGDACTGGGEARAGLSSEQQQSDGASSLGRCLVAMHSYVANPSNPEGFTELSVNKGDVLQYLHEHPSNEFWWMAKNMSGEEGYVPASYMLVKEEQAMPWLELASLQQQEEERKERLKRVSFQKDCTEGKGFGPPPTHLVAKPKPYVSAYGRDSGSSAKGNSFSSSLKQFYCEVCDKQLNGPKPYQAHMSSKAHKEELALLQE